MRARVALVTGAARGIGFSCARHLAREGLVVHVVDRDVSAGCEAVDAIRRDGFEAHFHEIDLVQIGGPADAVAAVQHVSRERLDVVVNNAFDYQRGRELARMSDSDFGGDLAALVGPYLAMVREARDLLVSSDSAAVVNLGSVRGQFAGGGFGSYSVAKAAVAQLTRALAVELGPEGVRVNAVAPGIIATRRTMEADEATRADLAAATPLRRLGQPDDVGRVVAFLASAAAGFITGQVFTIDGGLTLPLHIDTVADVVEHRRRVELPRSEP